MSVREIIEDLVVKKITLHAEAGNIKITGPKNAVTPDVQTKIKDNKILLLNYLESRDIDSRGGKSDRGIHTDEDTYDEGQTSPLQFGLFYFGNSNLGSQGYQLLLRGAKYADENNYTCVWTPERHFHDFGAPYPCPATLSAAVAAITKRIEIRAGSVVIPLHNPIRIVEQWSVVDNLSGGRVGIACASGWHANDFIISPDAWSNRHQIMYDRIDVIKRLWRGESLKFPDGNNFMKETKVFPRPVQKDLPLWLTSGGNIETFITAGKLGMKVLTHMLGTTLEELGRKIKAYRQAYKENGHEVGKDKVVLMLHTFLDKDTSNTHEQAKKPFIEYLKTSVDLIKNLATSAGLNPNLENIVADDLDAMFEFAYTRYTTEASLIGTPDCRLPFLKKLSIAGVDEIAALIDFGIDPDAVLNGLTYLTKLKDTYNSEAVTK